MAAKTKPATPPIEASRQLVGNVGLYFVAWELSKRGWNVLPTSRNARGVDIVAYSQDGSKTATIQVKALSKRNPVPLGEKVENLIAQYFVVCRRVMEKEPECFVLTREEILRVTRASEKADGKNMIWMEPKAYEVFLEDWPKLGSGF